MLKSSPTSDDADSGIRRLAFTQLDVSSQRMKTALSLLCLLPVLLHANGGGYISGVKSTGAFQPIGIDQVEMLSERLEIDLHIEYADIRIEYVLHNPGKKVKVEAGFPSAIAVNTTRSYQKGMTTTESPKLENFSLTVDGKTAKVTQTDDHLTLRPTSMYSQTEVNSWHRVKMDFAEGQTRKVGVRYRNPYYRSEVHIEGGNNLGGPLNLTYLFSAAGAWKGPIGQGVVTVRNISIPEDLINLSHSKRFVKSEAGWTWSFTNFEPTLEDDLTILIGTSWEMFSAGEINNEEWYNRGRYISYKLREDVKTKTQSKGRWEFHRTDFIATASSSLPDSDKFSYQPEQVRKGHRSTAWTEGAEGDGVGEWLLLTLEKPAPVRKLGIVPGYAKSAELYRANGRPAELDVSVNDGKAVRVKLPDEHLEHEHFTFDLPAKGELVKTVKLTIAKVYPGEQYQDTAISDIKLIQPLSKAPKIEAVR